MRRSDMIGHHNQANRVTLKAFLVSQAWNLRKDPQQSLQSQKPSHNTLLLLSFHFQHTRESTTAFIETVCALLSGNNSGQVVCTHTISIFGTGGGTTEVGR